jgi:hypothetical protein
MERFHVVLTFGYLGKPAASLAAIGAIDKEMELLQASLDDITFYTEVESRTGMDAAVKALSRAKRVEERLTLSLLEMEMQHCPESAVAEMNLN